MLGRFYGYLLHALGALLIHEKQECRETDEDVNEANEPSPGTKNDFDKVPIKKTNKTPVDCADPDEPECNAMKTAFSLFHKKES